MYQIKYYAVYHILNSNLCNLMNYKIIHPLSMSNLSYAPFLLPLGMTYRCDFEHLSKNTALLLRSQIENALRRPQQYRFPTDLYSICLWLYHYSPACYKALMEIIIIPSPRGLRRHVECLFNKVCITSKINSIIIKFTKILE